MDDFLAVCERAFELLGPESDAVIIVPPFADIYRPSLGVHLLQAAAERAGLRVRVLYANLLFATLGGEDLYNAVCSGNYAWMWGERIFARAAFGLPPLGYQAEKLPEQIAKRCQSKKLEVTFEQLAALEREAGPFCAALGERFSALRFRVAGATTTFHQTAASVALLAQVKRAKPGSDHGDRRRQLRRRNGAGNRLAGRAHRLHLLGRMRIRLSGFPAPRRGGPSPCRPNASCAAKPCFDMDSLPEPCFDDYFAQLDNALPAWRENNEVWLPYETSRGCWWGARQHCTFCGLNGETMAFRQKSPDHVIAGARRLLLRYPTPHLGMIDNILPHSYFRTVLPRLAEELPPRPDFL